MSEVQAVDLNSPAAVADPLADVGCKNRLQQYAQKAAMALPMYQTVNEGLQHTPHFRSRVWVDGEFYTSPITFTTRKAAEQSSARYALIGLREKLKNEARAHIKEDSILCKAIIHEYAKKMSIGAPSYVTTESKAVVPIFTSSLSLKAVVRVFSSSLSLNGATYVGDAGKNKKEAEQFAAREAILKILDSESGNTTMSEIMKSKTKFYESLNKSKLNKGKDLAPDQGQGKDSAALQISPLSNEKAPTEDPNPTVSLKRKEVESCGATVAVSKPSSGLCPVHNVPAGSEIIIVQPTITRPADQPFHEFKKHKPQTSTEELTTPIEFVPASTQPVPEYPAASAPAKKKKNKKNKKKAQEQSLMTVGTFPPSQVPVFSV